MGGKLCDNRELKRIGQKANENNPNSFVNSSIISLTNDIIIGESKADPENDYIKKKFLGEGAFASVYLVQNKITEAIRAMKVIKKSSNYNEEEEK
jgi:serine/threonine protein kinase